jgi:hypothetical protein
MGCEAFAVWDKAASALALNKAAAAAIAIQVLPMSPLVMIINFVDYYLFVHQFVFQA